MGKKGSSSNSDSSSSSDSDSSHSSNSGSRKRFQSARRKAFKGKKIAKPHNILINVDNRKDEGQGDRGCHAERIQTKAGNQGDNLKQPLQRPKSKASSEDPAGVEEGHYGDNLKQPHLGPKAEASGKDPTEDDFVGHNYGYNLKRRLQGPKTEASVEDPTGSDFEGYSQGDNLRRPMLESSTEASGGDLTRDDIVVHAHVDNLKRPLLGSKTEASDGDPKGDDFEGHGYEKSHTYVDIGQVTDFQPFSNINTVASYTTVVGKSPEAKIEWNILKSIVYGGLSITIANLGVVSSAAGADAKAKTVIVLGLANLIAGLLLILNNMLALHHYHKERFTETVGHSFQFNGSVAVLSYLTFGSLAPITYGVFFQESNSNLWKSLATGGVSLIAVILLALGKAHVFNRGHISTVLSYINSGFWASFVGFFAGKYIKRLLEKWGFRME